MGDDENDKVSGIIQKELDDQFDIQVDNDIEEQ